ncbi:alcohol dehydrogenase catalytic domain-containing protein [Luteibacter aegosomatissinici]|uniref:alcohol dehydrogenase catalytic domain-containing protein n=1 Tax=Luteibacter aegosomatissinici TaxID=2911539 RepID=UPI001FF7AB79|nr:alcohol dehydrogenase catalytic domain-containing protein [Luteibacter aegosomatissinici]UPG93861.1 alcohol dehydrogenase catalytic domain-containing protein [Luteibacter aegosomatissinici]
MSPTYRALQVTPSGALEFVTRRRPTPPAGEVLIQVEACGMCGADLADIRVAASTPGSTRVPGHEVVGRIIDIGSGVAPIWAVGQRVGVGRLAGHCGHCRVCGEGQFHLCPHQAFVGSSRDGGYAELMLARGTGLVSIPTALDPVEAAPILCAGVATLNALRKSNAQPSDTVAILGIGGLGHMAIQYANRMGFRVVAMGRGTAKAVDAERLGAHAYIDTAHGDGPARLSALGGAQCIISTVADAQLTASFVAGLAPGGRLILLAAGREAMPMAGGPLVIAERSVHGSLTGTPRDIERALAFSELTQRLPMVECYPLADANAAIAKLSAGEARFRLVLTPSPCKGPAPGIQ